MVSGRRPVVPVEKRDGRVRFVQVVGFAPATWGVSSADRARHSHCRGQEFESPTLHQKGFIMDFEKDVLDFKGRVLVDFYAEWCGPCQALKPILEEASRELPEGAKIVSIDVDEYSDLASEYEVSSIPCLVVFENGLEKDRMIGLVSKKKILKILGA